MEELTNIKTVFEQVIAADAPTLLNLMMVSGDYADLVMGGRNYSINVNEYGAIQGIYMPLGDLIDQWMHNYKQLYTDDLKRILTQVDGQVYAITNYTNNGGYTNVLSYINQRWLNELGLPMPKTTNQLTDTLRTFKQNYPDGYPMTCLFIQFKWMVFNAYGIVSDYAWQLKADGKTIEHVSSADGYREALEWAHLIFSEGLVDPEVMTQNNVLQMAKYNENNVGVAHLYSKYSSITNEQFPQDMELLLGLHADGYKAQKRQDLPNPFNNTAVTVGNKYVNETMRWLDTFFQNDLMIANAYGIEGVHYEMNGGKISAIPGAVVTEYSIWLRGGLYIFSGEWIDANVNLDNNIGTWQKESRMEMAAGIYEDIPVDVTILNWAKRTEDEMALYSQLNYDISTLISEFFYNSVINGITDAQWADFVRMCQEAGMVEFTELAQTLFDRYLNS